MFTAMNPAHALFTLFFGSVAFAGNLNSEGPEPEFGLDSYSISGYQQYFINNRHPSATDNNNQFGTPDLPRRTIPSGSIEQGVLLTIAGGPYEGPTVRLIINGSESRPVLIRGLSETQLPTIRQAIVIQGQYVVLENLRFDKNRASIRIEPGSKYIAVRRNQFVGPGESAGNTSVLGVSGSADAEISHVVFAHNEIRNFGDTRPGSSENDYHGIKASRYCSDIWIVGNRISNMGGDSVQLGDAALPDEARCSRIYVVNNEFFENRENAIDIKRADAVIVSGNRLHGFLPPKSTDTSAIVIHDGAKFIWVLANRISDSGIGVINTLGTDVWIIGNRFENLASANESDVNNIFGDGAGVHFRGNSSGGVLLNTFTNYRHGIQIASGAPYEIAANFFSGTSNDQGYDIILKSDGLLKNVRISPNLHRNFSAKVGSTRFNDPSQLTRLSRKKDAAAQINIQDMLCHGDNITLEDLDAGLFSDVIRRFNSNFEEVFPILPAEVSFDEKQLVEWCGDD